MFAAFFLGNTNITFDSGTYREFNYATDKSFFCRNLASYTKTLQFAGTFANVPQFIISSNVYDLDTATNEFTFSISGINTSAVNFTIASPQPNYNRMYQYMFSWIAIDDKRIEVINDGLNSNVSGLTNKIFTFPHYNINALKGFVCVTSFGYAADINFEISVSYNLQQISSINTTAVSVNFTSKNQNMLSIGFQVVLGTAEALDITTPIRQQLQAGIEYKSPNLTIPSGYNLSLPFQGMNYDNFYNVRFAHSLNFSWPYLNYTYGCFSGSYLYSFTHQPVWVNVANSKVYQPFILKKMRVTSLNAIAIDSQWKLQIIELNKLYKTPTTETIFIDKTIQTLTMTYSFKCLSYQAIQGTILKCPTCTNQVQSFLQNCYKNINLITYRIVLTQPDPIYQQINISVQATGFTITESIINQFGSKNYTVMNLMVVRK